MTHPRDEVAAAYAEMKALSDAGDWAGYADRFTDDAVYLEHTFGRFEGRAAIAEWLLPIMEPCKDWTFPHEWVAIDGDRVVFKWWNQLPPVEGDDTVYEFAGVTELVYAGDGKWSYEEDTYNYVETEQVMKAHAKATKR